MHTITNCSRCGDDFMYHHSDTHLQREIEANLQILENFPIQDESWPSRRWNEDRTDYCDLSGDYDVICQDCEYVETFCDSILGHYGIKTYQDYLRVVEQMWEDGEINELSEAGFIVVDKDKCEYKEDGFIALETNRVLTEKEFNARFKR